MTDYCSLASCQMIWIQAFQKPVDMYRFCKNKIPIIGVLCVGVFFVFHLSSLHSYIYYLYLFTELAEGNGEVATDRMESLIQLAVTTITAMVNLPLSEDEAADGRRKVLPLISWKVKLVKKIEFLQSTLSLSLNQLVFSGFNFVVCNVMSIMSLNAHVWPYKVPQGFNFGYKCYQQILWNVIHWYASQAFPFHFFPICLKYIVLKKTRHSKFSKIKRILKVRNFSLNHISCVSVFFFFFFFVDCFVHWRQAGTERFWAVGWWDLYPTETSSSLFKCPQGHWSFNYLIISLFDNAVMREYLKYYLIFSLFENACIKRIFLKKHNF